MQILVGNKVEARKEWSVPQLKKVDVEQITAYGTKTHSDFFSTRS